MIFLKQARENRYPALLWIEVADAGDDGGDLRRGRDELGHVRIARRNPPDERLFERIERMVVGQGAESRRIGMPAFISALYLAAPAQLASTSAFPQAIS